MSKITNTYDAITPKAPEAQEKKSSAQFGRTMQIDGFKNQTNLTIQDIVEYNPTIVNATQIVKTLEEKYKDLVAKEATIVELKSYLAKASTSAQKIRDYSVDPRIKSTELKSISISTNDVGEGSEYISVNASSIKTNQALTISVWQIASSDNISIGTAGSTEPTAVYNAINGAVSVSDARSAAFTAASSNISGDGFPSNPQSRILYGLCVVEDSKTTPDLATLKSSVTNAWNGMNKDISDGFETLSTEIIGNGANLMPSGTYYLYSMPHGIEAPKSLSAYITQASDVYDAIDSIASLPNITQEEVVAAISSVTGLTFDGDGLPSNNDFAYNIAFAAYNIALPAPTGTIAADVKAAAAVIATPENAVIYATNFGPSTYQVNSPVLKNIAYVSLMQSLQDAANNSGADLSSVKTTIIAALDAYKTRCSITLADGQTLETVIEAINHTTNYSGVASNYLQTGTGSYMLNIYAVNTGSDYTTRILDASEVDTKATLFGQVIQYLSPGSSAMAQIGSSSFTPLIVSNSNSLEYGGIYITLLKPNTNNSNYQTIITGDDAKSYKDKINNFIEDVNRLIIFVAQQNQTDPENPSKYKETTYLRNDILLSHLSLLLSNSLSYNTNYSTGFTTMANVGINLQHQIEDENLEYNLLSISSDQNYNPSTKPEITRDQLDVSLAENFGEVRRVFELASTIASDKLILLSFNGQYQDLKLRMSIHIAGDLGANNKQVQIEILDTNNIVTGTEYYDLAGSANHYKISCSNSASNLYGLNFIFLNNANEDDIAIHIRQGVADYFWAGIQKIQSQIADRFKTMRDDKIYTRSQVTAASDNLNKNIDRLLKNSTSNIMNINKAAATIYAFEQLSDNSKKS